MPSVAGNHKWSQQLRSRILSNRSNLCQLAHVYVQNMVVIGKHASISTPACFSIILLKFKLACWVFLFFFFVRPLGCAEVDDVLQKCERVLESLDQLDEQLFSEWTVGLEEICQSHLKEPLLTLEAHTGRFRVNFSPVVSSQKKAKK